jgi:hypothetical protein
MPAPPPAVAKATPAPVVPASPTAVTPPAPPAAPKQPASQVVQTAYSVRPPNPAQSTTAFGQPRPEFPKYVTDLIETLEHGKACEEALGAAFSLANSPWKTHPRVVEALMTAARVHPLVPVRVTAIRCLVGTRVTTPNVRTALQALKTDNDPAVRSEAEQALNSLVFFMQPGDGRAVR